MPVETPARPEVVHRDFYEVLGVNHGASEEAIRSAYRKLVRIFPFFFVIFERASNNDNNNGNIADK